ncbi:unnamed protein product [Calypogeia fissa]
MPAKTVHAKQAAKDCLGRAFCLSSQKGTLKGLRAVVQRSCRQPDLTARRPRSPDWLPGIRGSGSEGRSPGPVKAENGLPRKYSALSRDEGSTISWGTVRVTFCLSMIPSSSRSAGPDIHEMAMMGVLPAKYPDLSKKAGLKLAGPCRVRSLVSCILF